MIQQTIEEITFEDIILSKKQRQVRKSGKLRHWLQFLGMLDSNKDYQKKNQIISQMHKMFILREDFWLREVTRILEDTDKLTTQTFQFAFMSLDDGFYYKVAKLIGQKLFEACNNQKLRITFVVAKLQILIQQFNYSLSQCSTFYEILIQIYTKSNNTKKIRQIYKRLIQTGLDDYDVAFTKYIKWQEQQNNFNLANAQQLLKKGKISWEETQIFLEQQLTKIIHSQQQNSGLLFQSLRNNKRYLKMCLIYIEDLNKAYIDEDKYLMLLGYFTTQKQKLWYLRRMAFSQSHQLVAEYFERLEISEAQDQQVINAFKISLNWQNIENSQKYQRMYLSYLIRRINKHLSKQQSQEYNDDWGNKVQFFRHQILQLITKDRPSSTVPKEMIIQEYYYLWIQVETVLVRDCQAVQRIFQNLLQWDSNQRVYLKYAKYMIKLNDLAKARFIFNKTCQTYHYQQFIVNEYYQFLSIYGSIQEICKLKEKKKTLRKSTIVKESSVVKEFPKTIQIEKNYELTDRQSQLQQDKSNIDDQITMKQAKQTQIFDNKKIENLQENLFKRSSPAQDNLTHDGSQQKKKVHLDSQNTLFSKNIDKKWAQSDIMLNLIYKQHVNQIRIIQKQNGNFCYIDFDSEELAKKQQIQNKSNLKLALSRPPSKSNDCTIFLSNLPIELTKNQISELIPQHYRSNIKDIRNKQKNQKKTAYIQFDSENVKQEVLSILKKQKIKIQDKSIIAMSCESDHKKSEKKNRTIFLKNISFKCRSKDLKKFFQEKGFVSILEIFIPKDQKSNKLKGFAYIQFQNYQQAQKAYSLQKGEIFQRQFSIHRSDRAITHYSSNQKPHQKEGKQKKQQKNENKKSNNFFSNIFS